MMTVDMDWRRLDQLCKLTGARRETPAFAYRVRCTASSIELGRLACGSKPVGMIGRPHIG